MVSYERLVEYTSDLPKEAPHELLSDPVIEEWPSGGLIEFKELTVAYDQRPDYEVIKQFSAIIQPGEKIGVVGRTGAGKSTLISSLLRMVEPKSGTVLVDNVDISSLGLHTLRSRLQIIPQQPTLFSGSIRTNLIGREGNTKVKDEDIWNALDQVGMKEYIASLEGQLDAPVDQDTTNYSSGQIQLICLARAALANPKILLMDEATSSIDHAADSNLQTLIQRQFKDTTVITIAHRIATVSNYDKIMVMDDGRLVEFASPTELLQDPTSLYAQLVLASQNSKSS